MPLQSNNSMQNTYFLIQALDNPEDFKRLVNTRYDLIELAKQFPQHAEALIQKVFDNPEDFKRLVYTSYALTELAKQFPQHAEALIQKVFDNPEDFKRLVNTHYDLTELAKQFPRHAEALIQKVFDNPEDFKRLVNTSYGLTELAKQFPRHFKIFGQKSFVPATSIIIEGLAAKLSMIYYKTLELSIDDVLSVLEQEHLPVEIFTPNFILQLQQAPIDNNRMQLQSIMTDKTVIDGAVQKLLELNKFKSSNNQASSSVFLKPIQEKKTFWASLINYLLNSWHLIKSFFVSDKELALPSKEIPLTSSQTSLKNMPIKTNTDVAFFGRKHSPEVIEQTCQASNVVVVNI